MPKRPPNIAILAQDGTLLANRGDTGGPAIHLRELPPYLPKAFVAIEDRRFYSHFGIDPLGIGRALMRKTMTTSGMPLEVFTKSAHSSAIRVPGTAVFMASASAGVPSALLHNMKHNKVLHDRIVLMTVLIEDTPFVDPATRAAVTEFGNGFYRL